MDGRSSLVNVVEEVAGNNCANGGLKIETGIDQNANGTLDANEVQNVSYVCDGESLSDEGQTFLIISGDITNEEAQAKVDSEVGANTQLIIIKNTNVLTTLEIPQVESLAEIQVSSNKALGTLDFPNLVKVDAQVNISDNTSDSLKVRMNALKDIAVGLELRKNTTSVIELGGLLKLGELNVFNEIDFSLDLPQVLTIGNIRFENNSGSFSLLAPKLDVIGSANIASNNIQQIDMLFGAGGNVEIESLQIQNNPILNSISFDGLGNADDILIAWNESLDTLNLPNLLTAGDVEVSNNFFLSSITMDKLSTATSISINGSHLLEAVNFPQLESMEGLFSVYLNSGLLDISMDKLSSASFINITSNTSLEQIAMPALVSVNNLGISSNELLSSLDLSKLEDFGGDFGVFMNPLLSSINIDAFATSTDDVFSLNGNAFSSETVNYILSKFVSINPPLLGITINLTQTPAAPPTGQGIIDKTTLENNGNTVNTD